MTAGVNTVLRSLTFERHRSEIYRAVATRDTKPGVGTIERGLAARGLPVQDHRRP